MQTFTFIEDEHLHYSRYFSLTAYIYSYGRVTDHLSLTNTIHPQKSTIHSECY